MIVPLPSWETAREFPLDIQAGQLLMPAAFINDTEEDIRAIETLIREYHIGGICFFHSRASAATNFEGKKEIPYNPDSLGTLKALIGRYQAAATYPLLMAIDAEWGLAMRIENGEGYPYALCLGALEPDDPLLYQVGLRMGADCREAGLHWNLAPVADVNLNPENPVIGYRSFGSDPAAVGAKALAVSRGMQDAGLLTCAKHFPGHGNTAVDSHLALPVLEQSAEALAQGELQPFRTLIEGGVDAVMTGHLAVPAMDPTGLPCTLSPTLIREVLQGQLGYTGAVITDALNMHAVSQRYPEPGSLAVQALLAGNDMLCFVEDVPASHAKILSEAGETRIREAFQQVWKLKTKALAQKAGETAVAPSPEVLRRHLAQKVLSRLWENRPASKALASGKATLIIAGADLPFFREALTAAFDLDIQVWDLQADAPRGLPQHEYVLLAFSPPQLKPPNAFGISKTALNGLQQLLDSGTVWVCHFGNPYALQLLDGHKAEGILIAYQPRKEIQQQAAAYYLGQADAPGTLAVPINWKTL